MSWKCDYCDKPAVVHEVRIKGGVRKEVHLCAEHAQAMGIALPGQLPGHKPISKALTQFVVSKPTRRTRASKKACPNCGMGFAEFRQSGVLGCPDCYDAFGEQLGPMIERAQNGGTSHTGKCPRRGGMSIDRQLLIQRLVKELEDAVGTEQYERAAELRDRLKDLETQLPAHEAGGPTGN